MVKSKIKKVMAGVSIATFVVGVSLAASGCCRFRCCKKSSCGGGMKQGHSSCGKGSCGSKTKDKVKTSCSGGAGSGEKK